VANAAHAQQPTMPVIGFLSIKSSGTDAQLLVSLRQGLGEGGFVEGRNVAVEYRYAEGQLDRLPSLVADLVRRQVAIIVTTGSVQGALAAKAATTTIPTVFTTGGWRPGQRRPRSQPQSSRRQSHGGNQRLLVRPRQSGWNFFARFHLRSRSLAFS
jgi:ABC-type uncharacterized transport system substrate-binding protein